MWLALLEWQQKKLIPRLNFLFYPKSFEVQNKLYEIEIPPNPVSLPCFFFL
jgi:hypothetical protein